jgi:hypothetical protein
MFREHQVYSRSYGIPVIFAQDPFQGHNVAACFYDHGRLCKSSCVL